MSDCRTPKGYRQIFSEKNAGGEAKRDVPAESALRDALLAVDWRGSRAGPSMICRTSFT